MEPIRLFAEASRNGNNQRSDILLRGFGRQIILDVAVTGLDGQSRPTEDLPNRHLQVRYDQKMAMVTLLSRIDFNLFRLFFLTQDKFTLLSKICLGSRFVIRLLRLKVRLSRLKLTLL